MKTTQLIALLLLLSANAMATSLNLDYSDILKDLKACRKTMYGCTPEQQIEIARFEGHIMNANDLEIYLSRDTERSVFIPLELSNAELLTLAAATSLGVVAFNHDQEIMDVVQKHKSQTTMTLQNVGNFLGSGYGGAAIAAGSYFLGVALNNGKIERAGLFMVGASLAQGIITETVKRTFGRARPNADLGPYSFFNDGKKSFYSGHTAEAFTIATVIAEMYKEDYPVVPWVAYGFAAVTAYARVHDEAHWASDVIIGAVAGHLITKLAMNAFNGNSDGRGGLLLFPSYDASTGTMMINASWSPKEPSQPLKCSKLPDGNAKIEACLKEACEKSARR